MSCDPRELTHVPLFALLDEEEAAVLAAQVELKRFAPRQRIYKIGDPPQHAYIMMSGAIRVTTVDAADYQRFMLETTAALNKARTETADRDRSA